MSTPQLDSGHHDSGQTPTSGGDHPAVARLVELDDLDPAEHAPVYDAIHESLRDELTR